MLLIDPEADKVRKICQNKQMEFQQYYAKGNNWKTIIEQSIQKYD